MFIFRDWKGQPGREFQRKEWKHMLRERCQELEVSIGRWSTVLSAVVHSQEFWKLGVPADFLEMCQLIIS